MPQNLKSPANSPAPTVGDPFRDLMSRPLRIKTETVQVTVDVKVTTVTLGQAAAAGPQVIKVPVRSAQVCTSTHDPAGRCRNGAACARQFQTIDVPVDTIDALYDGDSR